MAKLSKSEIKSHDEAMALVECDRPLKDYEKEFILDNFNESALHINSAAGAFFTPRGLARDFAIEVNGGHVIDLCAGIGSLSYAIEQKVESIICVEINPDYLRIGKRIVPDAIWINASIFSDEVLNITGLDWAISNPPFGNIKSDEFKGKYTGSMFEFKTIEVASRIANYGAFILPQMSTPFRYSGKDSYTEEISDKLKKFIEQTSINMEFNCGMDTSYYKDDWRGVSPVCEIVICDFEEIEKEKTTMDLF